VLTSSVTTDEVQAGRVAADTLAEAITKTYADTEGDVAIITAAPDASVAGFREQVGKKYRALNILPDKVAESQAANGAGIIKDLVADDRDLRGVFVSDALLAEGASQVIYNKSGDSIQYVVLGADDKLLKSVQDGTVAALLVRDPFRIGYEGVKTALAAAKGERVGRPSWLARARARRTAPSRRRRARRVARRPACPWRQLADSRR
jgi:ribose transport system substrate-binding protein